MPIYEYKCECGTQFEKLVRNSSVAVACPKCGDERVEQQYSTFAAQTNGSASSEAPSGGGCGMCSLPGGCGRN